MTSAPELWEVHLRIPPRGPVASATKRAGERLTHRIVRTGTPCDALRRIEELLCEFAHGDQLFITARTHDNSCDTTLSMWTTTSKAVGLYWCATALGQLWRSSREPPLIASSQR
ncbi:MAG: hypothetical protein ABW252_23280 [Polyangiales bacterium]